jgi:ubiquinone/menaquinone biosynthesis C-methylase UbiE
MKRYWTEIGKGEKANWHIAHIDDPTEFYASGAKSLSQIFPEGLEQIPKNGFVLEIGCGKGRVTRALAKSRPDLRVFGVDVAPSMIDHAWKENAEFRNMSFVVGDGNTLSMFPDMLFDRVYSFIVFQHLPRHITGQYIAEAGRVLKPGGRLTFQVQQRSETQEVDPPWNNFRSIRYYTQAQATALVLAPLSVQSTRGDGHDFFVEAIRDPEPAAA